jgi:hypothetical protein
VHSRVDDLNRKDFRDLRNSGHSSSGEPHLRLTLAVLSTSHEIGGVVPYSRDDAKELRAASHEAGPRCCSERATVGQKVDGLKKTRLAGSIATDDSRSPLVKLQFRVLNAAEIVNLYRAEHGVG